MRFKCPPLAPSRVRAGAADPARRPKPHPNVPRPSLSLSTRPALGCEPTHITHTPMFTHTMHAVHG